MGVQGNLKAGDRVVAEGIQKVRDGMEVNPVPFGGDARRRAGASAEEAKP